MKIALGVVSPNKVVITDIAQLKGKTLLLNKGKYGLNHLNR